MSDTIYSMPTPDDLPEVVILADGSYPSGEVAASILANAGRVVCCDGAAVEYIRRQGSPYAIVGDCDSLPADIRTEYSGIMHCDDDQETNDLTKAVRFCVAEGFGNIVILGATGKREDHTIGNVGLLPGYTGSVGVKRICIITDYGVFEAIGEDSRFGSFAGQQVSILCPDPTVRITTYGLRYALTSARLTAWWQGTLNECLGDSFGIGTTGTTIVYRLFK